MDAILEVLGFLGDPGKFWKFYADLAGKSPGVAVLLGIPAVIYLSYIGLGQLNELVGKYRGVLRLGAPKATGISLLILVLAAIGSYSIVHVISRTQAARPILKFESLVIGRQASLNWSYGDDQKNRKNVRYQVESARDARFTEGVVPEFQAVRGKVLPISRDLNETRFFRVRAVEVEDGGGGTAKSGKVSVLSPWSDAAEITQFANSLERIKTTGRVQIYTSDSFNQGRFSFTTPDSITTGVDIELARMVVAALAAKIGYRGELEANIQAVSWGELFGTVRSGEADFAISSITSFAEREAEARIKFSIPYYQTTLSLVHRADTKVGTVSGALPGKTIGVQGKTTSERLAQKIQEAAEDGARLTVLQFGQVEEAVARLRDSSSPLDFVIADTPFAIGAVEMAKSGSGKALDHKVFADADIPKGVPEDLRKERYAIAVRPGETGLLAHINEILQEIIASGERDKLDSRMDEEYRKNVENMKNRSRK